MHKWSTGAISIKRYKCKGAKKEQGNGREGRGEREGEHEEKGAREGEKDEERGKGREKGEEKGRKGIREIMGEGYGECSS